MKNFTREIINETIANGFSSPTYKGEYEFYFHILAQCKVILADDIDIAGVNFQDTKYCLYINPENFNELPLNQRLGILKHEMLHIVFNHLDRKEDRQHEQWNCACDCAINQQIKINDLPKGCITPKSLEEALKKEGYNIRIPKDKNAELYYSLLPEETKGCKSNECKDDSGDKSSDALDSLQESNALDSLQESNPLDNHDKWNESRGDEDLKRDITKKIIEEAIDKSRGNTPNSIGDMLDIWTRKPIVSWKKALKNVACTIKVNKTPTIMKKSRRFPHRPEIMGYKKDRTWNLICIIDTSGSVSNEQIVFGLSEINSVCKITKANMRVLQVDTECSELEEYDPKKKNFTRKHSGGTYIAAGVKYLFENKIESDAIIVISDMYIENISTDNWWNKYKKTVIFLSTSGFIPEINKNHKIFNIDDV